MCEKFQEFCVWATCEIFKIMGGEMLRMLNCLLLYIDIYLLLVALKQYSLFMSQELVGIHVIELLPCGDVISGNVHPMPSWEVCVVLRLLHGTVCLNAASTVKHSVFADAKSGANYRARKTTVVERRIP